MTINTKHLYLSLLITGSISVFMLAGCTSLPSKPIVKPSTPKISFKPSTVPLRTEKVTQSLRSPTQYYQQGMDYYRDEYYIAAAQNFRQAAQQGHAAAQFQLANMYYDGKGVNKNSDKTVHWCEKAAQQGDADAQYMLGALYFVGSGVSQDNSKAQHWYQKAAQQDHVSAQLSLGMMYFRGNDLAMAKKWLTKAAKQGNQDAIAMIKQLD